jgi:hypothetical protein
MSVKVSIGAEFKGAKAFKQAETATDKLNKSVTKLGKTLGVSLGAAAVVAFGKASVRAFVADQKAATVLANTIKNLGLQMSAPSIENYIQSLERATGVADDQLRPAMQSLLQVTGSVTSSQKILAQAIEASRATGVDLTTVAQDLGQAYVGNTRGLRKYSLGLTQAELKAASFAQISARFNTLFGGANEAYLATYAGQMERLGVAAGEAQETIGKGLVDALIVLSGSKSVDELAMKMEKVAQFTANVIGSISRFAVVTRGLLTGKSSAEVKAQVFGKAAAVNNITPNIASLVRVSQEKKAEEAALKRSKALTKDKATQLAIDKAKASLAKAQANFDITKINLAAALKGKVTEDEKNRLLALQAIENGNGEEALKYIAKIDAARADAASKELARQKLSYEDAMAKIQALNAAIQSRQAYLLQIGNPSAPSVAAGSVANMGAGQADFGAAAYQTPTNPYGSSYYGATGRDPMPVINVNIDGKTVANAVYDTSNSGTASSTARTTGQFA